MEYNVNRYRAALLDENERHNMVSRKSLAEDLDKHIEDSLIVLSHFDLTGLKGADIGTGAGFPGLIMAMAKPDCYFTLIESDFKKSDFLQRVTEELSLDNVEIKKVRAEEIGRDRKYREKLDFCTSRAVTATNVLLEYAMPLLKIGGRLYLWKGKNYQQELEQASNALRAFSAELKDVIHYNLLEERDRVLLVIEKLGPTPEKYPRRTGVPAKRPL